MRRLEVLFQPRSIVVIGGSRDPRTMGAALLRNVRESYRGRLWWVNRRAAEAGEPGAFASVRDVAGPVDMAIVAVPARDVLEVVRDALDKGVRAIVMITAGFAELGDAAHDGSHDLLELVRSRGATLVGPNCLGIVSTRAEWPLNASFGPADPPRGDVAMGTQSGALGFVFLEHLRRRALGIAELVSLGNKLDLHECDFVEYWTEPTSARVVALYLESLVDPRRFVASVRELSRRRPVVVLKTGRTAAGERAAGSHTAALATPERLIAGALRQSGAARVGTLEELFDVTTLLARQAPPRGRRIAIVTNAGGPGVMATDALAESGWSVPELSADLQTRLREATSTLATVRNPVDLVGTIDAELFARCVTLVASSGEVDALVPIYTPRLAGTSGAVASALATCAAGIDAPPVLAAVFMEAEDELERLQRVCRTIPCYAFAESAARALTHAAELGESSRARASQNALPEQKSEQTSDGFDVRRVRETLQAGLARASAGDGWLASDDVQQVLAACGIATPAWRLIAADAPDSTARAAAEELRYPLVLKAIAPGVLHKLQAGALALDVRDVDEFDERRREFAARLPSLRGIFCQEYRPGGVEVFAGVRCDPRFGPVLACGPGGSGVEREPARTAFRLLPCSEYDLTDLVGQTFPRREATTFDKAVTDVLRRLAALSAAAPEIVELDLNPVSWFAADGALVALDGRMRIRRDPELPDGA